MNKNRLVRIAEAAVQRMREMDDAAPQIGTSYEDVRELARYHALNGDRDEMLYRDNEDYKNAYDDMAVRESAQKRFILESRAEKILGLRPNPTPVDVYMAAMNWLSGLKNPESDPDAKLVDRVIHNTMVKHKISKSDEHIGSKLNMLRRILDPDLARRQGYRASVESEMRQLDPTGRKQKYGYQTPNSLRMGESKELKITDTQLRSRIKAIVESNSHSFYGNKQPKQPYTRGYGGYSGSHDTLFGNIRAHNENNPGVLDMIIDLTHEVEDLYKDAYIAEEDRIYNEMGLTYGDSEYNEIMQSWIDGKRQDWLRKYPISSASKVIPEMVWESLFSYIIEDSMTPKEFLENVYSSRT